MASNRGQVKSVVLCALILGLAFQVEGKSCCRSSVARNCYNVCRFGGGAKPVCSRTCGCKQIEGRACPRDFPKLNLLPDSGEPDATEYCHIGCVYSVCESLSNALRGKEMNMDPELCSDACIGFCNGDAGIASIAA